MTRLVLSVAMAAFCLCTAPAVRADEYPSRPVHAIIPFGAGSATDVVPRLLFEQLAVKIGQPIVVENRGGAGGTIGAAAVAKAEPDGYTILATSSAHTITPAIYSNLTYDAAKDFTAIGMVGNIPNVLIIAPSKGLTTLKDFVAKAKANPGTFNFASVGVGSAVHLSAERFRVSAGYEAVHIPFKGGGEALTEIIAGRVDYYFCPISTALPLIREGRVLALAVSSKTRVPDLPDVPTTIEAGFADSDYTFWIGVFAPKKTPADIVAKLHAGMDAALAEPITRERMAKAGVQAMPMTPAEIDALVVREIEAAAVFTKASGLKIN